MPNHDFKIEESKTSNDENKEDIKVSWTTYFKLFTYTKWTIITILAVLLSLYLKKQAFMLFDYYFMTWIKHASKSFINSPDDLTKAIIFKVISSGANII